MKFTHLCNALLVTALSFAVGGAMAASIHVMPTSITLAPGKATAVMTITNEGDTPIKAQVRVFAWEQQGNQDRLTPTQKLVASPPMATLAPKQTQSIRVVRVDKSAITTEEAYRLVVDEIPDAKNAPTIGVSVQMRYSVPVFVLPKATMPPGQVTIAAHVTGNALTLNAQNKSDSHVQASEVVIEHAGGATTPVVGGLLGYVLAGRTMQWTVTIPANAAAKGRPVRMTAMFNGQPLKVDL
ncbi:molecular chaperone [Lysobacter sp. FW306-1B-D06B]|uniref:fimbrial biogenesis chaperone n=1 Tax=Lysobacter sp. FW306-1B-D06B TaxID=3140250 RepID=UPI0031403E35